MTVSIEGTWQGVLTVQSQPVDIIVHFAKGADGSESGTIDIPKQLAYGMHLANVSVDGSSVHFELPTGMTAAFDGTVSGASGSEQPSMSGTFVQGDAKGTFELRRESTDSGLSAATSAVPEASAAGSVSGDDIPGATATEVTIPVPGGPAGASLHGTLLEPTKATVAVLILAGSGPTDRNGNSTLLPGPNNSLKMVADGLAADGIASLRADKRGVGASAWPQFREDQVTFDDYVTDAVQWIRYLKSLGTYRSIFVFGHSEGGLIATLAAEREPVNGEIAVSTLGETYQQTLLDQLKRTAPTVVAEAEKIVKRLESGERVSDVPQQLAPLFRPSVQPFLISAFRYDPSKEIGRVKAPVLILQGDRDLQVEVSQAELLYRGRQDGPAMAAGAKTSFVVVHGMNHVLKNVPEDDPRANIAAYSDPKLPLSEGLMIALIRFIHEFE